MDWRALGVFGGLASPYSSFLFLSLIPALVLYCVVLISRSLNKDIYARKVLPLPAYDPFSSHIVLFLTVCYTNTLGLLHSYLAVGVWDILISSLSSLILYKSISLMT